MRVGDFVEATFSVATPVLLGGVELDLEGDGFGGCAVWGSGLDAIKTLRCRVQRAGVWNLWLKVITVEGCRDETRRSRPVTVIAPREALRCDAFDKGLPIPQGLTISPETIAMCSR